MANRRVEIIPLEPEQRSYLRREATPPSVIVHYFPIEGIVPITNLFIIQQSLEYEKVLVGILL